MEYSPILGVLTAALEIGAGFWALRVAGDRKIRHTTAAILFTLSGYQLIEVFLCGATEQVLLARLAFADVVWLPPLAIRLLVLLAKPEKRWPHHWERVFFVLAGGLTLWVMLDPNFVVGAVCSAVIASFIHPEEYYLWYGVFYQTVLGAAVFGGAVAMSRSEDRIRRAHIADLQMGILGFLLPALMTSVVVPAAYDAVPSVMCHFALILSLFMIRLLARERRQVA